MSREFFQKIKDQFENADNDIYFRVCHKDEDTLNVVSAEITEDRISGNDVEVDICEIFNYENIEVLKEDLENYNPSRPEMFESNLFWADDGHLGKGLYYTGVCCMSDMGGLADYSNRRMWHSYEGAVVRVFEGQDKGDCNDGAVAKPTKILFDLNAELLEREDVVEFIDYLLDGGEMPN